VKLKVSDETKMKINPDCYSLLCEDEFPEDDDYIDKDAIAIHRKHNKYLCP